MKWLAKSKSWKWKEDTCPNASIAGDVSGFTPVTSWQRREENGHLSLHNFGPSENFQQIFFLLESFLPQMPHLGLKPNPFGRNLAAKLSTHNLPSRKFATVCQHSVGNLLLFFLSNLFFNPWRQRIHITTDRSNWQSMRSTSVGSVTRACLDSASESPLRCTASRSRAY